MRMSEMSAVTYSYLVVNPKAVKDGNTWVTIYRLELQTFSRLLIMQLLIKEKRVTRQDHNKGIVRNFDFIDISKVGPKAVTSDLRLCSTSLLLL